jgi:endoglucanase
MKTYPSTDMFVIQVGDRNDHDQGMRMPENDALDGKSPALCAISPVHMGLTAAVLAKGAQVFSEFGRINLADTLLAQATAIFQRALQSDALATTAYEKDETNDFYHDNTLNDNMSLGALELYRATGEQAYLDSALSFVPGAGEWIGWGTYNFSVNTGLQNISASHALCCTRYLSS